MKRFYKGDIIINPWVSKEYNGDLNPCYATMYIGAGTCVDYLGRTHKWVGLHNENQEREYKVIGHIEIDLKGMILGVINKQEGDEG